VFQISSVSRPIATRLTRNRCLHRTEMNLEHVWCLRCTEAPDIAYALPISRKLVNIGKKSYTFL
jgi:hypothetical protein